MVEQDTTQSEREEPGMILAVIKSVLKLQILLYETIDYTGEQNKTNEMVPGIF